MFFAYFSTKIHYILSSSFFLYKKEYLFFMYELNVENLAMRQFFKDNWRQGSIFAF